MYRKAGKLLAFCLALLLLVPALAAPAHAADTASETEIINKVFVNSENRAVVMHTAGEIVFTTKTTGASISNVVWMDASGAAVQANDTFRQEVYTLTVTLTANSGYAFSQSVLGYIYGDTANVSVSMDGKSVSLRRNIEPPVWSPTISKHPLTDPAVNPGELVSYSASAVYATSSQWFLVSPDGSETLTVKEAVERFNGITIDDAGMGRIIIYNVPAAMNGWQIFCRFFESTGVYPSDTQKATIQVKVPEATPAPSPEATPAPSPEATPEPSPVPTPEPSAAPSAPEESAAPEKSEEPPEATVWKYNETTHWRESTSGIVSDLGEHRIVWSGELHNGKERGECSECGYVAVREAEGAAKQDVKGKILIGLGVAMGLLMMLSLAAPKKKKSKH